jgi:5-methyltetrahydrofolate--homocysteine methyltransferase
VRPPFTGARHTEDFSLAEVLGGLSKNMLFRARWGFHRKNLSSHEYERLIRDSAEPLYAQILALLEPYLDFRAARGYFFGRAEGNRLVVTAGAQDLAFDFPRQHEPGGLCIADFFRAEPGRKAVVPFFAVTIGAEAARRVREAFEKDSYKQYLLLHGLAAEITDAFAGAVHKRVAAELKLGALCGNPGFAGTRYGFGYPACPNLDLNRPLFEMLGAEKLGIRLTENTMMEPEYSTMGIIAYHPGSRYFSV